MSAPRLRAILFDLDDTLYEERLFFRSGFRHVATVLWGRGLAPVEDLCQRLEFLHHHLDRATVFQHLAADYRFPTDWIPELVALFRDHPPDIQLAADTLEVLPRLRASYRLGCVTDGWGQVQRRKVAALGVEALLDVIVFTDDHGREFWKPHPRPFLDGCAALGVAPAEAVFVGDNPARDMVGAAAAGLRAVRIRRPGAYFTARQDPPNLPRGQPEITDLRGLAGILAHLEG